MTYRRFLGFGRAVTAVFAVVCWLSGTATGAIIGPYTADANTLHLYHLNESAAPAADTGSATTLRPMSTEVGSPLGAASYSGFGNAASFFLLCVPFLA